MQPVQTGYNSYYPSFNYTPVGGNPNPTANETQLDLTDLFKLGKSAYNLPQVQNWLFNSPADLTGAVTASNGGHFNVGGYFNNLANGTSPAFVTGTSDIINLSGSGNLGFSSTPFQNAVLDPSAVSTTSATAGSFAGAAAGTIGGIAGNLAFNFLDEQFGVGGGKEGSSVGGAAGGIGAGLLASSAALGPLGIGIAAFGGALFGSLGGSFFGDDGDFPYASYSTEKGGAITDPTRKKAKGMESYDDGPIGEVEQLGNASQQTLNSIVKSVGIKADTLPTMAIGVSSGRSGSNLGAGIFTTHNDYGRFMTDPDNIRKWNSTEEASADFIISSLKYSDISGTSSTFQNLVMSYDGSNGVEVLGKLTSQYAPTQDYGLYSEGVSALRVGPRGKEKGKPWKQFHSEYKQSLQEGAAA